MSIAYDSPAPGRITLHAENIAKPDRVLDAAGMTPDEVDAAIMAFFAGAMP